MVVAGTWSRVRLVHDLRFPDLRCRSARSAAIEKIHVGEEAIRRSSASIIRARRWLAEPDASDPVVGEDQRLPDRGRSKRHFAAKLSCLLSDPGPPRAVVQKTVRKQIRLVGQMIAGRSSAVGAESNAMNRCSPWPSSTHCWEARRLPLVSSIKAAARTAPIPRSTTRASKLVAYRWSGRRSWHPSRWVGETGVPSGMFLAVQIEQLASPRRLGHLGRGSERPTLPGQVLSDALGRAFTRDRAARCLSGRPVGPPWSRRTSNPIALDDTLPIKARPHLIRVEFSGIRGVRLSTTPGMRPAPAHGSPW